jgi:hypothetical protein
MLDMLFVAGISVFDMLGAAAMPVVAMGVAGLSDVAPIVPLALPMLEGGDIVSDGVFLAQPANTNAARTGITNSGIFDFMVLFSFLFVFIFHLQLKAGLSSAIGRAMGTNLTSQLFAALRIQQSALNCLHL